MLPAAAPRRRILSLAEVTNVPSASPSEAKPAELESQPNPAPAVPAPAAASFVEVENQLEKMFAGIEEPQETTETSRGIQDTTNRSGPLKDSIDKSLRLSDFKTI